MSKQTSGLDRVLLGCQSLFLAALLVLPPWASAIAPDFSIRDGAVHLKGVGPDNPILYDNDWWFDVFDNNYLWAQASLGAARLRGNIVTRDMWDWDKGYHYKMEDCVKDARKALTLARDAGLKNIPDVTIGSDRVLTRPESGRIEDTQAHPSEGSRLIVAEARKASPEKPLLIIAGGPLTTVANALLTDPEIASHIVVFNLTVSSYGYNGKDGWSAFIVSKKARLVDWATGTFWDKNSVFTADHFKALPQNPFCDDMRRLIQSDLGQANQLGDGAALVWLWRHNCWTGVKPRRAVWRERFPVFEEVQSGETADVLDIPKKATDLKASREEFFRVLTDPRLFDDSPHAGPAPLPLRQTIRTAIQLPAEPEAEWILHVAPEGKPNGTGATDAPFADLEGARDAIRAFRKDKALPRGGVRVRIHDGEYRMTQTFRLTAEDSGQADAPIRYSAQPGGKVVFRGGERLKGWKRLTDASRYPLLPEAAKGKVWILDLKGAGIADLLPLKLGGFSSGHGFITHPAHELYFDGKALQPARGPNEGFLNIADVVVKDGTKGYDREGSKSGLFTYEGDRPSRWVNEPDLLLYGYWFWDWADSYERVAQIDPDRRVITLAEPWHKYGFSIGAPFYAYHALSEMDRPGEWYLDRANGQVLMMPPSDPTHATIEFSTFADPMVVIEKASHIRFEGLTWELGSADAIRLQGGAEARFAGCVVRRFAGNAFDIQGGMGHGLLSCDIHSMGRGGVIMSGGDRKTLTPGGHFIENCEMHDLSRIDHTYTPAIVMSGVGARIRHNRFHNILSSAIRLGGNDHVVEYNEIYDVVLESDDQGGLDMWGNATYRGNVIRYNYWHHIGHWRAGADQPKCGQCAVRLDDAISGVRIHGNIFERCSAGKTGFGGVQIHGGKDNIIEDNLFVDCMAMVSCTAWSEQRWQEKAAAAFEDGQTDRELYIKRYPELATLSENANRNHIRNNRTLRCQELYRRAPKNLDTAHNIPLPDTDFRPVEENPLFSQSGFEKIPIEEMGLYQDDWRNGES